MNSERSVENRSILQRPDCPTLVLCSSASASSMGRCYHSGGQFQWCHLVIVAIIAGVFPSAICLSFFYATQPPCDCRAVARQEVKRLFQEQFPGTLYDLSSPNDIMSSAHDPSFARELSSDQNITSSAYHQSSSTDIGQPSSRRRMRRRSSGRRQERNRTRNHQQANRGRQKNGSNGKCTDRSSCNIAAGIHLEFTIPALDLQMTERLQRINGSVETVEYGEISQNGFKPYAADRQNGTRYSFRNWSPAKWFNSSSVFNYNSNRGTIQVLQAGLYYVYSQIRFYHTRPCSYAVMVNDETVLLKCIDGTAGQPLWQFSNCYLGGVTALRADDRLWIRDMYGERSRLYDYYVHLDPALGASSFWGAIHLGQL